jgi:hypothetical protein
VTTAFLYVAHYLNSGVCTAPIISNRDRRQAGQSTHWGQRLATAHAGRQQVDTVSTEPTPRDPLLGLAVELANLCQCGSALAVIGPGPRTRVASLQCQTCEAHRGWISGLTHSFVSEIIVRFGRPTAPIKIGRSEQLIKNSDSRPECAPTASSAHEPHQEVPMRKHEVFPSSFYNSKLVSEGPILLTIDFVRMESVGEGANKSEKLVAHFREANSKLLVITPTKFDAIALIAESDETDDWGGIQIVLEAGKTQLQGKLVDCVNIRSPRKPKRTVAENKAEFDDEVGF